MSHSRFRGFTLIEVLIAIVIFSIGLLGLAGLMVVSVKTNQSAYLRTQAGFIAESMADRMRANTMAVWAGNYDSASYPLAAADPCPVGGAACGYTALATHDQVAFSQQLTDLLPNATGTIACSGAGAAPPLDSNPPYRGTCSMQITWDEAKVVNDGTNVGQSSQTFAWVFRP